MSVTDVDFMSNLSANAPEAIIFDLDGTLLDSARDLHATLNHLLAGAGRQTIELNQVRHMVGKGARELIIKGFSATGELPDEQEIDRLYQEYLAYYMDHIADHTIAFPGIFDLLDKMKRANVPMAVCTNKAEILTHKLLAEMNMTDYFQVVVGGDTFEFKKPDGRHLTETAKMLGIATEKTLMVGDSLNDIAAAKDCNMPVLAVSFGYTETPVRELGPDIVIDHYDEFYAAVDKMSF